MPDRLREAIASVRRISSTEALEGADWEPEPSALSETSEERLGEEELEPEPPAVWATAHEASGAEDREPEPNSLWKTSDETPGEEELEPEPPPVWATGDETSGWAIDDEASGAEDREPEPNSLWKTSDETPGEEELEPERPAFWETGDKTLDGQDWKRESSGLRETSDETPAAGDWAPGPPALWESGEEAPGAKDREPESAPLRRAVKGGTPTHAAATRRPGVHVGAFLAAAALVLLIGFGVGTLREVEDPARPTSPSATGAMPESGVAPGAQQLPPINEIVKVEPLPTPITPAEQGLRSDQAPNGALPLPPPPKPAPWSTVKGEEQPTTDRIDKAVDALLRQAEGSDGPFAALADEAAPPSGSPRVLIHYSGNAAGSEATAMHLARLLRAKGFAVETREVDFPVPADSIRYFFAADRDAAEALRSSLDGQIPGGAAPPVVDFTRDEPKPRQGSLELWIRT